jgi:hypothetical protein
VFSSLWYSPIDSHNDAAAVVVVVVVEMVSREMRRESNFVGSQVRLARYVVNSGAQEEGVASVMPSRLAVSLRGGG